MAKDGELEVESTNAGTVANLKNPTLSDQDAADLAGVGKRQQLGRRFGFWSMLGFTTTMMCTWEAVLFANLTGLVDGAGPTLIYGFIFSWVGSLATAASMAELASMAPVSGGQYHWVAILAPPKHSALLSWIAGWIATIGWNANTAAGAYFGATLTQGLLVLNYPDYGYERWHGTLLMYAIMLMVVIVNTVAVRLLPKIEGAMLAIHVIGFFAILIPLVKLAPHGSPSSVFSEFGNLGGFKSDGLAWFVGLISTNLPFVGYDGPCHMAEEVQNASRIVPRAMMGTLLLNGVLGFSMAIAFLFCIGDIETAIASPTGYDLIQVFYGATDSHAGTSVMTAILIVLVTFATFGFLATSSRQTWAFARDQGLPCSNFLAKVNQRLELPLNSILVCTTFTALICLINIGSTVAFNAIVSLTIAGLFISYMIAIALLVSKRLTNSPVHWGPWRLGKFGLAINLYSLAFLFISVLFSFFPPELPVTAVNMNWSCVVFGGAVILGLVWYAFIGRKQYNGPIIEIDLLHPGQAEEA
ncbi:amino acid transporter I-2 [Coleophoma cylindrospora]|uniref:Amino acid transporter I-2 n=1 Tax=Coleophoma cylindrospora TaxID=1849047 RepID=A0A3D8S8J2_9HELO|nr:amino acid transporter I-2 [Coleophoma cylindrospora]